MDLESFFRYLKSKIDFKSFLSRHSVFVKIKKNFSRNTPRGTDHGSICQPHHSTTHPYQRRAVDKSKIRVSVNRQVAQIFNALFVQPD